MARGQAIGAAGELIVQARLLLRGWVVGNLNTGGMPNAPAVDLVAAKGNQTIKISVKATGHQSDAVQWRRDHDAESMFKGDVRPDFVIFVWFADPADLDACRIFVVPADVVDRDILGGMREVFARRRESGKTYTVNDHMAIWWKSPKGVEHPTRGFAEKWACYENAWDILEGVSAFAQA